MMRFHTMCFTVISVSALVACGPTEAETAEAKAAATADSLAAAAAMDRTYVVDTANSTIQWSGTMVSVYTHTGTVAITEGTFTTKGGQLTGGSFVADLRTMIPTDEHYSATVNTKESLVEHLSSAEFFDVPSYPTASLTITGGQGNTATADLTIRGKTHSETITDIGITTEADGSLSATGKLVFDRQKYGVAWTTGVKDSVLEDDIELIVKLVARPK